MKTAVTSVKLLKVDKLPQVSPVCESADFGGVASVFWGRHGNNCSVQSRGDVLAAT